MIFRSKNRFLITFLVRGVVFFSFLFFFSFFLLDQASNIEVLISLTSSFFQILRIKFYFLASILSAALENIFWWKIEKRGTKLRRYWGSSEYSVIACEVLIFGKKKKRVLSVHIQIRILRILSLLEICTIWNCFFLSTAGQSSKESELRKLDCKGRSFPAGIPDRPANDIPYLVSVIKSFKKSTHSSSYFIEALFNILQTKG